MDPNPSPASINAYINWVIYAVLGRTGEADDVMRRYKLQIEAVARQLRKRRKPPIRDLYRGVLLEPDQVVQGVVPPEPALTFLSFSEDFEVACWFADPDSIISGHVRQSRPNVEGWIIEHRPKGSEILWHYSWNTIPMGAGRSIPLVAAGAQHPHIMRELDQLAWNLQTQREVILKPLAVGTPVTAYALSDCPQTAELDARLAPPAFRANASSVRRALVERAKQAYAEMAVARDNEDVDAFMRAYRRAAAAFDEMTDEEARVATAEIRGRIWTDQ